jgi:hypothetical protein
VNWIYFIIYNNNNMFCRKLHNEELHNLYSSPSIFRMIKSRRMRWVGHVAGMGEKRNAYRIWESQKERTTRKTKT